MVSLLLSMSVLVITSSSTPQRNDPRVTPSSQQFIDLLPDNITRESYQQLVGQFKEFLQTQKLKERGDFVDIESLECSPKLSKYSVSDPNQCDKFYECDTNGKLTERLCPDGFVYDIPGKYCNHPQRVECEERTELQEPQSSPGCPRQNGYFNPPDPERCSEFVECVDGLASPGQCNTGVVWSNDLLACTVPDQSGREECIQAVVHEFTCPNVTGPLRFGNHDRLANPRDCGLFYICLPNGKYDKASCGKPKVFSEEAGACLEAEEVPGCEDYNRKEEVVDIENLECTPKLSKYTVSDSKQCDKFYECDTNGKLTERLCPDGFVYDIPGKLCKYPQKVECDTRTELQKPQQFPGCPRRNGYFNPPEPEKCNEYVECVNGLATPGLCSNGEVWSPKILSCTAPAQSGRNECLQVAEFSCPPVTGTLRFGNHDRLANPKDCGLFYICLPNGRYDQAACEKPKVFSEEAGLCLEAEKVPGCEDYNEHVEE